jgi:hypothetical protein
MSVLSIASRNAVLDSLVEVPAEATFVALVNQDLAPGVRVIIDDHPWETATVCSAEKDAPYTWIRIDRSHDRQRVASWRLSCVD